MGDLIESFTAFRVFGKFHWPPLPTCLNEQREVEGVVEFHYIKEHPNSLSAVLRWLPRPLLDNHVSTPFEMHVGDPIDYVPSLSAKELEDRFKQLDHPVMLRLDNKPQSVVAAIGERLLFRGASVFDQFALNLESNFTHKENDPIPDLRWVLARKYNQGENPFFSEVVIEQNSNKPEIGGSTIRFNLALPTPIPQSTIKKKAVRALPFSVTYPPIAEPDKLGKPLLVETFMAGSSAANAQKDSEKPVKPGGRGGGVFHVNDSRLGKFGFCVKDGNNEFLPFPERREDRGSYWLENTESYRDEMLGRLGKVSKLMQFIFGYQKYPRGEFWSSVQFMKLEERGTRIVFRSGIVTDNTSNPSSGDFGDDLSIKNTGPPGSTINHFFIRNPDQPDQPDQWINTNSSQLVVELDLNYDLRSSDIWRLCAPNVGLPTAITVRLGFPDSVEKRGTPSRLRVGDLFDDAIEGMGLARIDLQHLEGSQPQSIFPVVKLEGDKVRFALTAELHAQFEAEGLLDWGKRPAGKSWSGANLKLSLWPEDRFIGMDNREKKCGKYTPLVATIALHSFTYANDPKNTNQFPVELTYDPAAPEGQSEHFCNFRLLPRKVTNGKLAGRLGSLEFVTGDDNILIEDDDIDAQDYSHWRFGHRRPIVDLSESKRVYPTATLDIRLRLDIDSVTPLGVDVPWGDRTGRPRPLLIPLGTSRNGKFILDLRETLSENSDRLLKARLLVHGSNDPANANNEFVVIAEEPFSITKFRSEALENRGAQDNASVASYDSDTRIWQVKLVSPNYHYEFPPQVVGESMDKPRRLEIHDLERSSPNPNAPSLPPTAEKKDVILRRAVEFRLSPSAEIWIEPSDVLRGYFIPEWASYEIFRQSGAYGLGVALVAFRGEFLYGLSLGIDVSKEIGIARGARVAEIEALTGRPLGAPEGSNTDSTLTSRWERLSRSITRRPERLEFWNRDLGSSRAFVPARFEAGVAFALRNTAVHRPAIAKANVSLPFDPQSKSILPRSLNHGLSGGALWPIESANLFNRLLEDPVSDGGSIERIALSPNGGDADQKAEFLNRQVAIISETRNGFVQRHKVEVIGRITVFWHRAKHVVVYERTVNPTAQFTPEGGIRDSTRGNRTRRSVPRKVGEYIELLQPSRSHPDFPSAKPATSGFLRAVRFNSKTINVDSAWSEDVGKYGWKIPLWNRDSARKRPQVYPRPDIGFVTYVEGEGDEQLGTQECLDPENIFFFADFGQGGSDTDSWPSRVGVDCSALPPPRHEHQPPFKKDGDNSAGDRRQASALRVPRGHRRFTWRLAPAAKKTVLNAGRASDPLYAQLESITFMRAIAATEVTFEKKLEDALKQADSLSRAQDRLQLWGRGAKSPLKSLNDLGDALKAFLEAAETGSPADKVIETAVNLKKALGNFIPNSDLSKYIQKASEYANQLTSFPKLISGIQSRCDALSEDFLCSLKRNQLRILEHLAAWENVAQIPIPAAPPGAFPKSVKELKDDLIIEACEAIQPALSGVSTDRLGISRGVEAARSIIRDFESDVLTVSSSIDTKLSEFQRVYDDGKPWSEGRIQSFLEKLDAECKGTFLDIDSAISDARLRLATELDDLSQRAGVIASEAIWRLGDDILSPTAQISIAELVVEILEKAIGRIDSLLGLDNNGKNEFTRADGRLAAIKSNAGKYAPRVQAMREALATLEARAKDTRTVLNELINTIHLKHKELSQIIQEAMAIADAFATVYAAIITDALTISAAAVNDGFPAVERELKAFVDSANQSIGAGVNRLSDTGSFVDQIVSTAGNQIRTTLKTKFLDRITEVLSFASDAGVALAHRVSTLEDVLNGPYLVNEVLKPCLISPVIERLFFGITEETLSPYTKVEYDRLIAVISRLSDTARDEFEALSGVALSEVQAELTAACEKLGGGLSNVLSRLADLNKNLSDDVNDQIAKLELLIKGNNVDALKKSARSFDCSIRMIVNEIASSYSATTGFAEKAFDSIGNLDSSDLATTPGNILNLYSAVASAPTLPNLSFSRERIGYYFEQLTEVIHTTPVEAWFARLGDELKAIGLSLPFNKISDRLLPDDLSSLDIGRVFKNLGGISFEQLFKGYKLPKYASDAIKITHGFDGKRGRAWVQIEVDIPIPERRSLFNVGPFQLDFVDSHMKAKLRLEADMNSDKVEQTGQASVATDIEAVVSGQAMVTLRKVEIRYERSSGLKVDFDPKNIKLNPAFQFIQDTLGMLFPDEIGGLKIIKQNGIPVGVEHEFSMPPVSLMYGTSGVTNIQISNRFALIAYPDFVIANRFSLSKPEMPFMFSIFIIGGTGYITVDTEYKPFNNQLMVIVEAAAGGSAALGFAFGPVSGSVFVTLSVALSYRKLIGDSGGGLTVALVLVIAGNVSVAGIVTVYIGLLLRMSYRDNGQIDATGTLTLTVRISRFFKISVRANVQYKLRGGRSETSRSMSDRGEVTDANLGVANGHAMRLLDARG